ncbi:MAG: hypothetical protein RLZZ84_1284 [Pseudomonadota bacterium]|jgi:hypothetical protein
MPDQAPHPQTAPHQLGQQVAGRVLDPLSGPQHFIPPSVRELRAQAVQRLQAGLFGIAAIVLIVGLANIINDRARQAEAAAGQPEAAASTAAGGATKTDPLADIGVVPATTPENRPSPTPSAGPGRNH